MIVAIGIILTLHLLFISLLYVGWRKAFDHSGVATADEKFISIIVPVRNEEKHISRILDNLLTQQYAAFEIIIVDDHSEDQTEAAIAGYNSPLVKCIQNEGSGKKHALATGISVASGNIIATTDADCTVPAAWLRGINNFFSSGGIQMVVGPVSMQGEGTLFSHMQQIEFASLIGSAASAVGWNSPVLCNGANLAFLKETFVALNGYEGNMHVASGDDEFLMRKIHSNAPGSVTFMTDPEALVKTMPQKSLYEFLQQRLRWAGKWRFNSSLLSRFLAVFIFIVQLATIISFYGLFTTGGPRWLVLIVLKAVIEVFVLKEFCRFSRVRIDWIAFITLFFIYPFYVVYIAIVSNFHTYEWKGRSYRK